MQRIDYDGKNLDDEFVTIPSNLTALDMVLYDGFFYVTAVNIDVMMGQPFTIEVKLYKVQELKGAVAVELPLDNKRSELSYLSVNTGEISEFIRYFILYFDSFWFYFNSH